MTESEVINWLELMLINTKKGTIYNDPHRDKKAEALNIAINVVNSNSINIMPDKKNVFHEVFQTLIYHKSKIERDIFERWFEEEASGLFAHYLGSKKVVLNGIRVKKEMKLLTGTGEDGKFTNKDLAAVLGYSCEKSVSQYLHGKPIAMERAKNLEKLFDVSLDYLLRERTWRK